MDAIVVGECMVELSLEAGRQAAVGYAGDTFNTAVYLSRLGVSTAYATAVGKGDPFSEGILGLMADEGLDRSLVVEAEGRLPGLYAIQRDARGERSFFYWRESAPARDYMRLAPIARLRPAMKGARLVYVSAITLAILGEDGRGRLLQQLVAAQGAGARVVLDTNYRARLWPGSDVANAAIEEVAACSGLISASAADLEAFGVDPDDKARAWAGRGAEVILRLEDRTIWVFTPDETLFCPAEPPIEVVDTTGAGDSFNAGYLAARLARRPPGDAVDAGRALAGAVCQHRGAIIPRGAMPAEP